MSYMTQFEREEAYIIEQMDNGEISQKEGQRELDELYRDYQAAAKSSAQQAYDDEMERW